jgi:hypothetical protein
VYFINEESGQAFIFFISGVVDFELVPGERMRPSAPGSTRERDQGQEAYLFSGAAKRPGEYPGRYAVHR